MMLRARLKPGAGVDEVADAVLALWGAIGRALDPIIGQRGVAALYHRSLKLTARSHPWLAVVPAGPLADADADLAALKAAFTRQSAEAAVAGGDALFETFRELLASLVGDPLTERLLRSVWTPPQGAVPQQDISS